MWSDLFNDKTKALEKLSSLSYEKLKQNKDITLFDDAELKNGLTASEEKLSLLIFDHDKLTLYIPPYQVAPYSTGEIKLDFDYKDINKYLNYKGGDKSSNEDSNLNKDLVRKTRNLETLKNKKIMLITFDDGPAGKTTTRLLDELSKRDVRVTFFVLGERIEMYPDIVKREYQEGHTVASHTYSHRNLINLGDDAVLNELNVTNKLLYNTLGITNKFIRPPYGSSNNHVFELAKMSFIYWSIDSLDWKYKNADTVYKNIMAEAKNGAISLAHDLYNTSVDGVLMAIDDLISQGYSLISLEEAEALGYIDTNVNASYYSIISK